jgi:hypothetical protein
MTVRVATYNVYLGADLTKIFAATSPEHLRALAAEVFGDVAATDFPQRARGIVAGLGAAGWPDLVGCQEVCVFSTGSPDGEPQVWCDFTAELSAAFAEAGAPYDVVASAPTFGGRMPISPTTYVELLSRNVTFARLDSVTVQDVSGGPFEARLEIPTQMSGVTFEIVRSWTAVTASVSGVALEFANTHLETYDADIRAAQLAELLARLGPGPAVVVGDLNERPHALVVPAFWSDAWVAANGSDGGFTCVQTDPLLRNPASTLDHRIDYLLARDLAVVDCRLVGHEAPMPSGLWPSDHAGVVASVTSRPAPEAWRR